MALMNLKVTPTEGAPISVKVTPKVMVAAERHFQAGFTQLFDQKSVKYETLAWVAHQALMYSGYEVKTFELWLDGIDDITTEESAVPL